MFIAMNRFRIARGKEAEFVEVWKQRDSYLSEVPGFKEFHLLQGESSDEYTLFASHSVWESRDAFEAWTHSEAFRKAHSGAGSTRELHVGPPHRETVRTRCCEHNRKAPLRRQRGATASPSWRCAGAFADRRRVLESAAAPATRVYILPAALPWLAWQTSDRAQN